MARNVICVLKLQICGKALTKKNGQNIMMLTKWQWGFSSAFSCTHVIVPLWQNIKYRIFDRDALRMSGPTYDFVEFQRFAQIFMRNTRKLDL